MRLGNAHIMTVRKHAHVSQQQLFKETAGARATAQTKVVVVARAGPVLWATWSIKALEAAVHPADGVLDEGPRELACQSVGAHAHQLLHVLEAIHLRVRTPSALSSIHIETSVPLRNVHGSNDPFLCACN